MNCTEQELVQDLRDAGFEPRSYSGRGMYGKRCIGVPLRNHGALWALARAFDPNLDIPAPDTDTLGLGIIAYWPHYEWQASFDDDNVCQSCGDAEATRIDGLCDECRDEDEACPDCDTPTENGCQCVGCRAAEAVRS